MKKKLLTIVLKKSIQQQDLHTQSADTATSTMDIALQHVETISLKHIISMLPGSIYWKDRTGRYLGCNQATAAMCNFFSPDDIVGKKLSDFFPADIAEPLEKNDLEVMRSGKPLFCEEIGMYDNTNRAIFLSEKQPLYNKQGDVIGLVGVSFDITERKQMEEELKRAKEKAEESDLAKSQFLAVINHELRTPLTSILGLLQFIKQGNLSLPEQNEIIRNMENCTQHLLHLVDGVLEFSRLEAGNFNLPLSSVNLNALLFDTYTMLKVLAHNKGLEFTLNAAPLSCPLFTNAHILGQILINLVTNAIKFTEKGHVTIQLDVLAQTEKKVQLKIDVIDTGRGIPADKVDVIFEPFRQLDDVYTKPASRSGTGLGLAIVKKLVHLIRGTMTVTSQPGLGSVFSLEAQFKIAKPKKKKVSPQPSLDGVGKIAPILIEHPTILLIEDDHVIQFIHKKMLQALGCIADMASSGHEAIEKLKHHHLVFVDINLPDMSGFEVIREIRKQTDVPIVALTAYNGREERIACLNAGANLFKTKPISANSLKKIVNQFLSIK